MGSNHGRVRVAAMLLAVAVLGGCGVWGRGGASPAASQQVQELILSAPDDAPPAALDQYWLRNTLVIDMRRAGAAGRAYLSPRPGARWPQRIAFRVQPGSFQMLEVRGDARVVLPITPDGSGPVDLELAPSIYSAPTARLEIDWGPAAQTPAPVPAQSPGS